MALLAIAQLALAAVALASVVQGPRNPVTVVDDPSAGSKSWQGPENAAVNDGQYALFASDFLGPTESHYLKATDFGFAIPSGATIDGIEVGIEITGLLPCPGVSTVQIAEARLVKGGVITATSPSIITDEGGDLFVLGDETDLWGETWAAANINAADFGFAWRVVTNGPGDCAPIVLVDVITITVFYTGCGDGQVQAGEQCDDGNLTDGDCCSSTCQFEAAGMPCPSDGNVCNGVEACDGVGACQHGTPLDCDDGNLCTQDSCDPLSGCANDATPATGCKTAEKSLLILKNNASDAKDKLIWKWIKGESTTQSEFGVPTGTTAYALCIYSGTTAAADYTVPGDAVKWRALGDTGYKYKDPTGSADGITKVLLKGSTHDTSKCLVKGTGANLDDPALEHLDDSNLVVVQLVNDRTSACFESTFTTPEFLKADDPAVFKAKSP